MKLGSGHGSDYTDLSRPSVDDILDLVSVGYRSCVRHLPVRDGRQFIRPVRCLHSFPKRAERGFRLDCARRQVLSKPEFFAQVAVGRETMRELGSRSSLRSQSGLLCGPGSLAFANARPPGPGRTPRSPSTSRSRRVSSEKGCACALGEMGEGEEWEEVAAGVDGDVALALSLSKSLDPDGPCFDRTSWASSAHPASAAPAPFARLRTFVANGPHRTRPLRFPAPTPVHILNLTPS